MLVLASCQNEPEGLNIVTGDEVDTVVTVTLPEAATRADWNNSAEGAFANVDLTGDYTIRYIFQVFYNEKEATAPRKVVYSDGMTVSFPVRLVPNRDYQFVVWADVVSQGSNVLDQVYEVESTILADNHYNTADLKNIQLKETWVAMDETRDAFTATYEAKDFNGAQSINIELYRPFAKLRVVTTDYDELAKYGITANLVEVDYLSDIYVAYNAFAGDVTGEKRSAIKHNKAAIKTYDTEVSDENTIYTDYFFAPKAGDVVKFNLKVWESETALIKENNFTTDIQVKANYLTTLKGKVLTTGNIINITTNPGFGGTDNNDSYDDTNFIDYTVITSGSQFVQVVEANKSGKFVLGNNITIVPSASQMAATRTSTPSTTVINLNGKVITAEGNAKVTLPAGKTLVLAGEGTLAGSDDFIDNTNGKVIVAEEAEVNGVNEAVKEESKITNTADWLADVLANGGEYVLTADMTIAETDITATAPITIDGNNKTITTNGKGLRFQASNTVNIKNLTIVNASSNGRCIDTRTGNINLTFNNVNLIAKGTYSQPLTIGGSDNDNLVVNLNNSTIEACHYGIITFNPVALNINNSEISGYAALYIKPGSAGSEINVVNSILTGPNKWAQHASNSFATVAIEDNNININIDGNSTLVADSTYNEQVLFAIGAGGATEALRDCNIVVAVGAQIDIIGEKSSYVGFGEIQKYLYNNVIKFPAAHAANLEAEGWIVSEPVNGLVTLDQTVVVSTADELVEALKNKASVKFANDITVVATDGGYSKAGILQNNAQTIDGNGYTLTVTKAGGTWDCAIYTNGGLIKNLTVAGSFRGIFTAGQSCDLYIENVTFKNVVYTFHSDGKEMPVNPFGVYVSKSNVNGWTSHSDIHTEVVYTNCSFGESSGYKFCRPYGKTEFVNCTFCPGYTVDQSQADEITFTDCTFEE